jgi:hypothetical protein
MPIFEEREKAAEQEFEHEREPAFKILARRNRLLGLWAAGQLGLAGKGAERYAFEIVDAEVTAHGDAAVVERICSDFGANGFPMTPEEVRHHLVVFAARARQEVMKGAGRQE